MKVKLPHLALSALLCFSVSTSHAIEPTGLVEADLQQVYDRITSIAALRDVCGERFSDLSPEVGRIHSAWLVDNRKFFSELETLWLRSFTFNESEMPSRVVRQRELRAALAITLTSAIRENLFTRPLGTLRTACEGFANVADGDYGNLTAVFETMLIEVRKSVEERSALRR